MALKRNILRSYFPEIVFVSPEIVHWSTHPHFRNPWMVECRKVPSYLQKFYFPKASKLVWLQFTDDLEIRTERNKAHKWYKSRDSIKHTTQQIILLFYVRVVLPEKTSILVAPEQVN